MKDGFLQWVQRNILGGTYAGTFLLELVASVTVGDIQVTMVFLNSSENGFFGCT